jgi:hypothetical protein
MASIKIIEITGSYCNAITVVGSYGRVIAVVGLIQLT